MAYFVKSTRSIGLTQSVLHFNFKSGVFFRRHRFVLFLLAVAGIRPDSVQRTWVNAPG